MSRSIPLPAVNRAAYFRADGPTSVHLLAQAIGLDGQQGRPLSDAQLAVYAWAKVLVDVPNGGLAQFFYNLRGDRGVAPLCDLLASLGQPKPADWLRRATAVYQANAGQFRTDHPWDDVFGKVPAMEKLDKAFGSVGIGKATAAVANWCREHLSELVVGDDGGPIDVSFTGTVEVRRNDGSVAESLAVRKGKADGAYREFFDDGSVRRATFYKAGKETGDYWSDGQPRKREFKRAGRRVVEWYYPSGQVQKRMVMDKAGPAEPVRLFHENGQLAEEMSKRGFDEVGPWLKFFPDGSPQLEAEFDAEGELVVRNAWEADGRQTVRDGTGTFADDARRITPEYALFHEGMWPSKDQVRDGRRHGRCERYHDGVLWSVSQYLDGKREGESTSYWDNGRVRSATVYLADEVVSEGDDLPKFDRPVPAVVLEVEADAKLYAAWRHMPVDTYPAATNLEAVRGQLQVPAFLRDVYDRNVAGQIKARYEDWNTFDDGSAYILDVDADGTVTNVRANGSGVYSGGSWDVYKPLLAEMRFTPGRIRGRAVACKALAKVSHTFVEDGAG